jgi:cell division protein ZapA (FtsZ GTPase activity inhibitor)
VRRNVTVTVADSHVAAIEEVASALRDAGMDVSAVLAAIGVVTGSIEEDRLAAIAGVGGVASVEEQANVQLAPPDAEVQ